MHLQNAVDAFDRFVRCIGLGPQIDIVKYDPDAPLHDRYKVDFDFVDGRGVVSADRHHADHQRVLRLGLQLVRVAAQGRRLAPDRLREPVPRLAGHVAALPLPVAGQGDHPVVDVLRGDQAQDAQEPRLGAVLRDRRRRTSRTARSSGATRRSPTSASRPSASRSSARTPAAPRRGRVGVLRQRRRRRTRCARRSRRSSRRTRSSSSPSSSGACSSSGAGRSRSTSRARQRAERVIAKRTELALERLAQEVTLARWGDAGQPVLLFPTAAETPRRSNAFA